MIAARLNNAHEKEKVKRQIKEEESEEAKRERQREWRNQVNFFSRLFIDCGLILSFIAPYKFIFIIHDFVLRLQQL